MKFVKVITVIFSLFLMACTDVISVEVPFEGERLVIEASLDWEKGTLGQEQTIILSLSSPYFDDSDSVNATGASVTVTNNTDGTVFVFNEENNGEYTTTSFEPVLNQSYTLKIIYDNETYTAEETLFPLTGITSLSQSLEGGIDPELIDIEIYFEDPVDEENYYLIIYQVQGEVYPYLETESDTFKNGNTISYFYEIQDDEDSEEEPLEQGDVVDIELLAISKAYYNYMDLLLSQTLGSNNPFSPVPVSLKGNCVNVTNPENSPFGYFRVTESDKISYTIQ